MKLTKTPILRQYQELNVFCISVKLYYSKIEVLQSHSAFFVSISIVRGKYEGRRKNKKHIFYGLIGDLQVF